MYMPYIGNHSQKNTFVNFMDFGMIAFFFLATIFCLLIILTNNVHC